MVYCSKVSVQPRSITTSRSGYGFFAAVGLDLDRSSIMASPLKKIERAHQMYRDGRYEEALDFYTEALSMAKTNPQRIALHSNRAACYLKLQYFKKAAEECTSVLELDRDHTGALMLRAQTLVTLKEYNSSLFDVNRLMELNPSSEVYRNLEARLRTQLSLAPIPESELEEEEEDDDDNKEMEAAEESVIMEAEAETTVSSLLESDKENNSDNDTTASEYVDDFSTEALERPYGQANDMQKNKAQAVSPHLEEAQKKTIMKDKTSSDNGWMAIPKPKGHSTLDYGRWDSVEDNSSEDDSDEEDEEECLPQYRFRVRTVGVRPVK